MKFSLIPILLVFFVNAEAQDSRKSSFGFFIGAGGGGVIQEVSEGGGSMDLKTGISVELSYYRSIATKVSFETGLVLYSNKLILIPPFIQTLTLKSSLKICGSSIYQSLCAWMFQRYFFYKVVY